MTRQTALRSTILLTLAAGLGSLTLPGCETLKPKKNVKGESIFENFAPPTPQQAAAWAVDPYSADKRFRGMLLIANAPWGGERVYVDMYVAALKDTDPSVRAVAVRALALHGDPEHVPLILDQLKDPDRLLRWEGVRALQRLHNPIAITPLIDRLTIKNEFEPDVRAGAAIALGQYAEGKVVDALISALDDRDLAVNDAARASLKILTGQDLGYDVREWVAWTKSNSTNLFASRGTYEYPVFYRDRTWYEYFWPFGQIPNEVASAPIGMPATTAEAAPSDSTEPTPSNVRNQ